MYLDEKKKAEEKKKNMDLKGKDRQELLEKKRIEKIKENEKMRVLHKKRFENEKQKQEEIIKRNMELMEQKLIKSELKRQQLEELQKMVFKKKSEEALKKQEEIQKFFQKEKEKEEMRNTQLDNKVMEVEAQRKIMEKIKEEEIKQKNLELKIKERKTFETREVREKLEDNKRNSVVEKINEVFYKVKVQKEGKERELMFKNEQNSLKRSETMLNVRRIENMKEYETVKKREKIEEKYKRSIDIKEQKSLILNHKRFLSLDTSMKRQIVMNKFDDLDLGPELEETIKRIFPEDPIFIEKIQNYKENLINQSSQMSTMKTNFGFEKKTNNSNNEAKQQEQQQNKLKISILSSEYMKKSFAATESKSFKQKSANLLSPIIKTSQFNKEMKMTEKIKEQGKSILDNYRISERSWENENIVNKKSQENNIASDKNKQESDPEEIKNNIQKNLGNPNVNSNLNLEKFEKIKNKNPLNVSNSSKLNQIKINNPNKKIKISNESSDKIIDNNNKKLVKEIGNNLVSNTFNDNNGKNISININNKITNFYNMINLHENFRENQILNQQINNENAEIHSKIRMHKSKINSESVGIFNPEKLKENKKQRMHENIKNIQDKSNNENEISKKKLKSSENII